MIVSHLAFVWNRNLTLTHVTFDLDSCDLRLSSSIITPWSPLEVVHINIFCTAELSVMAHLILILRGCVRDIQAGSESNPSHFFQNFHEIWWFTLLHRNYGEMPHGTLHLPLKPPRFLIQCLLSMKCDWDPCDGNWDHAHTFITEWTPEVIPWAII